VQNGRPSNKGMAPSKPGIMRLLEDKARRDVAEVVAAKVVAATANDTTGGSVTPTNNLVEKENDDSQRRNVLRHDVRKNDLINLGESQDHPGSTKSDLQSPVDANVGDNWDFQDFQWMRM